MVSHEFLAKLCSVMLIGCRLHCSCSARDDMRSKRDVLVIHLVALFWTLCSFVMLYLAIVCSGIAGYVSDGLIIAL